jgi:rhodanese-related sulfurtransferase
MPGMFRTAIPLARRFSTASVDGRGLVNLLKTPIPTPVVVIDVRDPHEIAATGRVSDKFEEMEATPSVRYGEITLNQMLEGGFNLPEDEFEDAFEFPKPSTKDILVFTCAAGVRSASAQKIVTDLGFSSTINYLGGAQEFFRLEL